jgi:peptide deformylase
VQIIKYPHPTLRRVARPLRRVDAELRAMIAQMFALMYAQKGIGLAATQVDLPYRLFIINLTSSPDRQDQEHVFLNPVLSARQGMAEAEEGCLSLPGLYGHVRRPERVTLSAFNLAGDEVNLELDDLFARAVQHEVDHLDGVLFIDRLAPTELLGLKQALNEFEVAYSGSRERGDIPDDARIAARLAELEAERT